MAYSFEINGKPLPVRSFRVEHAIAGTATLELIISGSYVPRTGDTVIGMDDSKVVFAGAIRSLSHTSTESVIVAQEGPVRHPLTDFKYGDVARWRYRSGVNEDFRYMVIGPITNGAAGWYSMVAIDEDAGESVLELWGDNFEKMS